jgi:hypothetical protein
MKLIEKGYYSLEGLSIVPDAGIYETQEDIFYLFEIWPRHGSMTSGRARVICGCSSEAKRSMWVNCITEAIGNPQLTVPCLITPKRGITCNDILKDLRLVIQRVFGRGDRLFFCH